MKLIWMSLLVTIFVNGMKENEGKYNSLDDIPSLADNKNLKNEKKFEEENLSKNGIKENHEFKNIDFSKANLYKGKSYGDMFKTLDKGAISLTPNNQIVNSAESIQNLNFDDYMSPFPKVICNSCGGRIFRQQLYIGNRAFKNHAICEAGYGGYKYSFSHMGASQEKYNKFQKALLKIFKASFWLNSLDHVDFIWNKMETEGYNVHQRTADYLIHHVRKLKKEIAYCLRKYKREEVYWYIHRSNWPKPEDVNWKAYIVEILKTKGAIPLIDFDDWNWEEEMYVPWKLLHFIKEYTKYSSFERAVRDIPNVEIFYCNKHSRVFMRLKHMPYSLIIEPKLKQVQNGRTKEETIKFLKERLLTEEQINFLLAKNSQTEIADTTDNKLNPMVEKAVNFVKRAQKSNIPVILSEERLINFMKEKGLTTKEINFVFTETRQTDVPVTAYCTASSQGIDNKSHSTLNTDEIGFKYQGNYNPWTPPEEKRKNEATPVEESLSETNSLFDDNIYQENSNQNSPTKNSSIIKKYQI